MGVSLEIKRSLLATDLKGSVLPGKKEVDHMGRPELGRVATSIDTWEERSSISQSPVSCGKLAVLRFQSSQLSLLLVLFLAALLRALYRKSLSLLHVETRPERFLSLQALRAALPASTLEVTEILSLCYLAQGSNFKYPLKPEEWQL